MEESMEETMKGATPGPWEVLPRLLPDGGIGPHIDVKAKDGTVVAFNVFIRDAALLAAAPDLLAALREQMGFCICQTLNRAGKQRCRPCTASRAAIAKAEGR